MSKFCPRCGTENVDDAVFCEDCGYNMKETDSRIRSYRNSQILNNFLNFKFLAAIIIIAAIIGVMFFSFSGTSDDDSHNITLIKENTYGFTFTDDGVPYYNYQLEGVFTNLEGDFQGYDMKAKYYDTNGSLVREYHDDYMKYAFSDSKKSQTSTLASIQTNEFYNMSYIQVEILNPEGDLVFNESIDFDMNKMDLSGIK